MSDDIDQPSGSPHLSAPFFQLNVASALAIRLGFFRFNRLCGRTGSLSHWRIGGTTPSMNHTPTPAPDGLPQVVWFKRDLRLADHAPLRAAALAGPVVALVVIEPDYWRGADVSARQWRFWRACLADLARDIAARGGRLCVRIGDCVAQLAALRDELGPFALWAHEETGNAMTFARDRAVRRWARANGVAFAEMRQFGVFRGPRLNRDRWSSAWERMMDQPCADLPAVRWRSVDGVDRLPSTRALGLRPDGLVALPEAGRAAALAALDSFLHQRGERYTRAMSSPISAPDACSRVSWHLSYGTLSLREVWQHARARYAALPPEARLWRMSLRSFMARLHWHCHFIQKLEAEPAAEFHPFARVYQGLRPRPADPVRLAAWSEGRTGYPFVDAAMRYLIAHGWINFRMRAMLMSFATYDLWLPWQEAGLVLARYFVDYEPGIHWPQCQMQAGETGINTVRIYSPVKQGYDQDPDERFIRQWLPELAGVPQGFGHEPWRLYPAPAYPARLVDHVEAARAAKQAIHALRAQPDARNEAQAVFQRHGSRKRTRDRLAKGRRAQADDNAPQLQFDW